MKRKREFGGGNRSKTNVFTPIDKTAPRIFTQRLNILLSISNKNNSGGPIIRDGHFYRELKERCPHLSHYTNVQIRQYITRFNESLIDVMIEHRDGVTLPLKMGTMMIATFGRRGKAIDLKRSSELGRKVYYRNEHSEGFGGGVLYTAQWNLDRFSDSKNVYANARFWNFSSCRHFNLMIAKAYKTDWKKYWVMTKQRRISDLMDKAKKAQIKGFMFRKETKDYNEFENL